MNRILCLQSAEDRKWIGIDRRVSEVDRQHQRTSYRLDAWERKQQYLAKQVFVCYTSDVPSERPLQPLRNVLPFAGTP